MTKLPSDLHFLMKLIKERSGIALNEQKLYLLESRLPSVAKNHGFLSIVDMARALRFKPDETITKEVIEAITTNESSFFRDIKPFEQFRNMVMPSLLKHMPGKKRFRILSAACSHGQEPYSVAMSLLEDARYKHLQFEIIGTDISQDALQKAQTGLYTQFEVQRGVPVALLIKYFTKEGEDMWRLKENVKNMVQFKCGNLIETLEGFGMFDIIFCRNVLIYFDPETKASVLQKLGNQLEPHGLLFLGCTESISMQSTPFRPLADCTGVHCIAR